MPLDQYLSPVGPGIATNSTTKICKFLSLWSLTAGNVALRTLKRRHIYVVVLETATDNTNAEVTFVFKGCVL